MRTCFTHVAGIYAATVPWLQKDANATDSWPAE